jgi:HD-like signal output (HDOD) protein
VLKALDEIIHTCDSTELTEPVIAEVFTSLHAAYGFRIMQAWHLPQQYADIALKHHETDETKDTLLMIVRLVDAACAKIGIGMHVDDELVLEAVPEAQYLGAKDVHLAELQILLEELADSGF